MFKRTQRPHKKILARSGKLFPVVGAGASAGGLTVNRSLREVAAARDYAEAIIATRRQPMVVLNGALRVHSVNAAFLRTFRVTRKQTVGQRIYDLGSRQWEILRIVETVVGTFNDRGELVQMQGYVFNDTDRKQAEATLQQAYRLEATHETNRVIRCREEPSPTENQPGNGPTYPSRGAQ